MSIKATVLGLAGKIASGKSTLSVNFAEAMGWPYISFGDYVRSVTRQLGLDDSRREILQDVGASLVAENCEEFCRAAVSQAEHWRPGESLVIDGIRHIQVKQALEKIVPPSAFVLGYLTVDDHTRRQRWLESRILTEEKIELLESASTEMQAKADLIEVADFVLDGTRPITTLIEDIKIKLTELSEAT